MVVTLTKEAAASLFPAEQDGEGEALVADLAAEYIRARKAIDATDADLSDLKKERDRLEMVLLAKMEEQNTLSLRLQDGDMTALLSASETTFYSLPSGGLADETLRDWLDQNGGGDAIKLTIHAQTFSALCRQLAANGKDVHPAVRVAKKKTVAVRAR